MLILRETGPSRLPLRAAFSVALVLLIALPAAATAIPPQESLNNGFLRFGKVENRALPATAAEQPSVNIGGTLNAPYYAARSTEGVIERWLQLTFDEAPLDFAVGVGRCVGDILPIPTSTSAIAFEGLAGGKCFWHRNMSLASSNGTSLFPDYNGGTTSGSASPGTRGSLRNREFAYSVVDGVGTITVTGEFDVLPTPGARFAADQVTYSFRVEHRYELVANQRFLRARTTLTNITPGGVAAPNVNIWVGTRDDYLGESGITESNPDRPRKERGIISGGTFTLIDAGNAASNAIRVSTSDESILFFSTTPGVNTVFQRHGDFFTRIIPTSPEGSGSMRRGTDECVRGGVLDPIRCYDEFFDGSYAIYLPAGDLAGAGPGASRRIDWFYAAGPVSVLEEVITAVSTVADEIAGESTPRTTVDAVVAEAVRQAAQLEGTESVLVRGSAPVPVTTTVRSDAGPRGGLVIEDETKDLRVTVTTAAGVSPTAGVVVPAGGEIVCEVCAELASGSVVEAWVYSTPRLTAAVRVDVDAQPGTCPLLRIPVGSPLDGGGAIEPGAHTLQLRMYTENGFEVLAFPISIGGPVPSRVPSGEGSGLPLGALALVAGLAMVGAAIRVRQRSTVASDA